MAWIESHQSLARHRKTLAVASALKVDRHKLIGHLHELWWWGLDNADSDGLVGEVPDAVLTEAAGWPMKQASMFVGALIDAGFIDRTERGLVLHHWTEYAGRYLDKRAANAQRMRDARAAHVQRTFDACAGATVPDHTGPNPTGLPARQAGRTARAPARGAGDLQPLSALLGPDAPPEVLERLSREPIGQPAMPAKPEIFSKTETERALG